MRGEKFHLSRMTAAWRMISHWSFLTVCQGCVLQTPSIRQQSCISQKTPCSFQRTVRSLIFDSVWYVIGRGVSARCVYCLRGRYRRNKLSHFLKHLQTVLGNGEKEKGKGSNTGDGDSEEPCSWTQKWGTVGTAPFFKVTEFQLNHLTRPLEWFSYTLYHLNLVSKFFKSSVVSN